MGTRPAGRAVSGSSSSRLLSARRLVAIVFVAIVFASTPARATSCVEDPRFAQLSPVERLVAVANDPTAASFLGVARAARVTTSGPKGAGSPDIYTETTFDVERSF